MKNFLKSTLMWGAILFGLAMCLTSCEGTLDDVFGEWSRPTGNNNDNTKISVTSIELDKETLELAVGDADVTLTATVKPDDATDKTVTWSSDNEDAATVADGVVHAVAVGTAIITAKAGDKSATCEVTVAPGLSTPLTLEVLTEGTIVVNRPQSGMQYSTDGGVTKKAVPDGTAIEGGDLSVGTKVSFYGSGSSITAYYSNDDNDDNDTKICGGTAEVKVYGNIMSLLDEAGFATLSDPITMPADYTFQALFAFNTKLKDANGLLLPATSLKDYCYSNMFLNCTGLTAAPKELPATTLKDYCYSNMFYSCTGLTAAPKELPAMTLKDYCYSNMFQGCSSLTAAPELKAETLASNCCLAMFLGCTKLAAAPELKAETLANKCYSHMFEGCSSLTAAPELKAGTLATGCYYWMFKSCSKLSSVTCLATNIVDDYCTTEWLDGAGTDASVTSKTIYINSFYSAYISDMNNDLAGTADNAQINTNVPWKKGTSGIPAGWTIVDYVAP